jgi:hypothetical protein
MAKLESLSMLKLHGTLPKKRQIGLSLMMTRLVFTLVFGKERNFSTTKITL